jgi:hypothetical protein
MPEAIPWSIFNYAQGDQLAVAWAEQLCRALGAPVTASNVQFIYNWERSEGGGGAYNPLNQGPVPGDPALTNTGQQFGGGAAGFVSWQAGLAGAVAYLNMPNYAAVKQALMGGNAAVTGPQALWASPWAASHYGYGSNWNTQALPGFTPNSLISVSQQAGMTGFTPAQVSSMASASTGATAAGGAGAAPAAGGPPTPPPLSNMPALIQYIQKNFPDVAWMLGVPAAARTLEDIVASGTTDPNQIQAKIQASPWWKTTSAAMRQYEQTLATDPSAYSLTAPGSQAQQTLALVNAEAGKLGVQLTPGQARQLTFDYYRYGWQTTELDQAIGSYVTYGGPNNTNAGDVVQQLRAHAGQYLLSVTPAVLQSWAQNIVAGTQNLNQFDAYLARNASTKWTGMSGQIGQGMTPMQITDNLRQEAAKTMEVDPNSIDFVNNPMYSRILDFVPPAAPGHPAQAQPHRMMTTSEMDAYLKGTDQWQYTQQARDQASALGQTLAQTWGKMGA